MFCSKLSDILEIIKVCCRRKRNRQLKASGLEQMAEPSFFLDLISLFRFEMVASQCLLSSVTDVLCPGELQQAGPEAGGGDGWWWCVWVCCEL